MVLDVRNATRVFCLVLVVLKVASTSNLICPINCRCESEFNKVNCSAANVDESTLKEISERTENLDLSRNDFTQLPETLYTYFENIVVLDVSFNKISAVRRHVFARMDRLRELDLSNNRIRSLSDVSAFVGSLNVLQVLNLSANQLENLGEAENQILYSDTLLRLDASRCRIAHLHGTLVFQGLPKLEVLNLSRNPLARIEGLFSDSLRSLDVSDSQIKFLHTDTLDNLQKLRELRVANNVRLSDQYSKVSSSSLAYLDASYCSIDSNYASQLPEARIVVLRGNQIRAIPPNAFENNSKLENLDLSANRVTSVDEFAFNGAHSLRYLDLSENSISTLASDTFAFTLQLVHLNLSLNAFDTLHAFKAPSLRYLDVSYCKIKTIVANALLRTPLLQAFNVSYNFVERLPDNFSSKSLRTLNAAFCRLVTINATNFHQLPALRDLDLRGNRLVYVRNTTFLNVKLKVNLADNPWRCDCLDVNFHTLWKSLADPSPPLTDRSTLVCQYPENVTSWTWEDACAAEWSRGPPKRKDVVVLLIIVTILFVSGVVACVVALRENWVTHNRNNGSRSSDGELDHGGSVSGENSEGAAVAESIRKLTQLPTYDEALLLPRLSFCDEPSSETASKSSAAVKKRQSATQTDETMIALLREAATENVLEELAQSPKVRRVRTRNVSFEEPTTTKSENQTREQCSSGEVEYINIAPLSVQCTEL